MRDIAMSTWMDLSGGAPLSYSVSGSDVAHVVVGAGGTVCELVFDLAAMRCMARLSHEAAAEMDAIGEREAAGHPVPGRHRLTTSG